MSVAGVMIGATVKAAAGIGMRLPDGQSGAALTRGWTGSGRVTLRASRKRQERQAVRAAGRRYGWSRW